MVIGGAVVELRAAESATPYVASSDQAGNFSLYLPHAGEYRIRVERLGFFVYQAQSQEGTRNGGEKEFATVSWNDRGGA